MYFSLCQMSNAKFILDDKHQSINQSTNQIYFIVDTSKLHSAEEHFYKDVVYQNDL